MILFNCLTEQGRPCPAVDDVYVTRKGRFREVQSQLTCSGSSIPAYILITEKLHTLVFRIICFDRSLCVHVSPSGTVHTRQKGPYA